MNDPVRILIADDHALFRDGLRALLNSLPETEVVGDASTGAEAVAQAIALQPNVVLMDLQMPQMDGVEATREIVRACPQVGVIVVTMFEDDASVFAAMRAGARGYILKGAGQKEMLRAIHAVARGEALFGAAVARRLASFFHRITPGSSEAFPELTKREQEVLELLARGFGNKRIAQALDIQPKTVRNHVSSIFSKLQVANRAQAILRARAAGLGEEE